MPLYFFRIRNGRYSGASDQGIELADRNAAWNELTSACADMVSGISRKLKQDSQWEMELLDEAKRPIFRIRLVAEALADPPSCKTLSRTLSEIYPAPRGEKAST